MAVCISRRNGRAPYAGSNPSFANHSLASVADLQCDTTVRQPPTERGDLNLDDPRQLLGAQGVEQHHIVESVEELRLERRAHDAHHLLALALVVEVGIDQEHRPQVGRQDQDGVLEVDDSSLAVGQTSVIEHLQQDVEDLWMRLLDLVQQDDRVRTAPHGFGELSALFISDVSRRRTDEPGDGVLLAVLAHVDAHHGVRIVEQEVRECLRQFGFADAGGSKEQERARGPIWVSDTGARPTDRIGHRPHCLPVAR